MKKIGFVDFYLSEWHANNYPAWIRRICEEKGVEYEIAYAWAEEEVSPVDGRTTAQWCEAYGVEPCTTIEELCEKADAIIILAPSNPEKHLSYAKAVFPYAKPTYVDKTFAPNLSEAKEIFALAETYHTPFFSSSALRYEESLNDLEDCRHMTVFMSGLSLEEYIIHDLEMLVKKIGVGASSVLCMKNGSQSFFHVSYPDDRSACVVFSIGNLPEVSIMEGANGVADTYKRRSAFFIGLLSDVLRFFSDGKVSFDTAETLEIMKLRDAILASAEQVGTRVSI